MIVSTKAIILNYIKYQESSIIVKAFTEKYGLMSFIVSGLRHAKSKKSIGYFQPFSILEMVIFFKESRSLQRISEFKYGSLTPAIGLDIRKSTIAIFLSEVLSKVLSGEQDPQPPLYQFIEQQIIELNDMQAGVENFHLHFLFGLATFLGFGLESEMMLFKSMEKEYLSMDHSTSNYLKAILTRNDPMATQVTGQVRNKAIEIILEYFKHHGAQLGEVKSLKILHQLFN